MGGGTELCSGKGWEGAASHFPLSPGPAMGCYRGGFG